MSTKHPWRQILKWTAALVIPLIVVSAGIAGAQDSPSPGSPGDDSPVVVDELVVVDDNYHVTLLWAEAIELEARVGDLARDCRLGTELEDLHHDLIDAAWTAEAVASKALELMEGDLFPFGSAAWHENLGLYQALIGIYADRTGDVVRLREQATRFSRIYELRDDGKKSWCTPVTPEWAD